MGSGADHTGGVSRQPRSSGLTLGFVVAGWCLHDLVLLAWTGYPRELPALLLVMTLVVVMAVAVGRLVAGRRRMVLVAALVALAILLLGALVGVPGFTWTRGVLGLVVFLAVGLSWIASSLVERWTEDPATAGALDLVDRVTIGVLLGMSAASVLSMTRGWRAILTRGELVWPQVLLAVAGVACVWCFAKAGRTSGYVATGTMAAMFVVFLASGLLSPFSTPLTRAAQSLELGSPDSAPDAQVAQTGQPNVVVVVLDTVRADRLAPYGYERLTTPRLDAFVERSSAMIYPRAYSTSSWTVPSHGSLLTGLPPSEHGAVLADVSGGRHDWLGAVSPLPLEQTTLSEHLSAMGYETAGIVANSPLLARGRGFEQGFRHYDDSALRPFPAPRSLLVQLAGGWPHIGAEPWRDAVSISRAAIEWLERVELSELERLADGSSGGRARPFFLFLNYMDAHMPLIPRKRHRGAFGGKQPADVLKPRTEDLSDLYDRKLLALDEGLDELLSVLSQRPDFDDTLVVVTSDHGEAFGEHDSWGHNQTLYEEVIRVPLYVKWPARCTPARDPDEPVRGYEVWSLIVGCVGLDASSDDDGWPLAELRLWPDRRDGSQSEPAAETVIAWLSGDLKSIVDSRSGVEIYDLERDPLEAANLVVDQTAEAWTERAVAWWQRSLVSPSQGPDPTAADRARLRRLGYVE